MAWRLALAGMSMMMLPLVSPPALARSSRRPASSAGAARVQAPVTYTRRPIGKLDQAEVGGPFVGVECHKGSVLPTRFSFFYPVATSIDRCPNYWKRGDYPVMEVGLKAGAGPVQRFGKDQFTVEQLTPYSAKFTRSEADQEIKVSYEFCKNRPATVVTYTIKNTSAEEKPFKLFTKLMTSLHSSHNYNLIDKAWTEYASREGTIYTHFDGEIPDTCLFVGNAGEAPRSFTSNGDAPTKWTAKTRYRLAGETISKESPRTPVSAFAYEKILKPGQSLSVVQIIGTAKRDEAQKTVCELRKSYRKEIDRYERQIVKRTARAGAIASGSNTFDDTARVAKAILAANEHHIYGRQVPMPCPAQYPYHFTHDILMKNLAAAIFDPKVVKRDLRNIASHANAQGQIPHAIYWKNDRYATEYAKADNWNHFWFTLVSSRYLRHTGDTKTLKELYPLLKESVRQMLVHRKGGLIHAYRPDWWDIGSTFGPRSYMTILAIRSLREFLYISTVLGETGPEVRRFETIAAKMQTRMQEKLWDGKLGYLINFNAGGKKDPHLYTGSMLAAHFDLVDAEKKNTLIGTARRTLVDEKVGVLNAFPMDFGHKKQREIFKFNGDEAGDRYKYMNGGIWYHGNAWYALGLIANGKKAEAQKFMKRVMTVDGIMKGPNGQPAMYECRSANEKDPSSYGKVDKPQFLWASSWYLYTLYHLMGLRENAWNVSFDPFLVNQKKGASYTVSVGGRSIPVSVRGQGSLIRSVRYDGQALASAVLPHGIALRQGIEIELGAPATPYLASSESLLLSSGYDAGQRTLTARLRAFAGHRDQVRLISPHAPRTVSLDGAPLDPKSWSASAVGGGYQVEVSFTHRSGGPSTLTLGL